MNRSIRFIFLTIPLLVACDARHTSVQAANAQAELAQATPAKAAAMAGKEPDVDEFRRKEAAFLGLSPDDPICTTENPMDLPAGKRNQRTALNILLYADFYVSTVKQQADKALGGDLEKASKAYDLALLRSDLIRGDIKAGRLDKAHLLADKMSQPMTPEEQALLEVRNAAADAESVARGTLK